MTEKKPKLKTISHEKKKLGYKATVAAFLNGQEIYKHEVKLWNEDSRKVFAKGCISKLNGNLTSKQKEDAQNVIDSWLRTEEERLRAEDQKPNPTDASNNGRPKQMTEEEKAEALALLKDPNFLARVQEDLTTMGVVDEERNKVLLYLVGTSRKMPQGLAATIKASSSAGKNHLVNTVASLMPEEDVKEFTSLSPKALYYMGEDSIKNKLVICTEIVGREQAEYSVRALISEREITCAIPVRNHDGEPFHTQKFTVKGPIAYLDTTTSFKIHPENATRVFEVYLNESQEQTEAINDQQAVEASPRRFKIMQERERIRRVHQNAQRLLRSDLNVVIPYAELIKFPREDIRARRDFPKLLNLTAVVTFLHQYQRGTEKQEDGKEYIEATLLDYELAYNIAKDTFVEMLDDLDKRSTGVLEVVKRELEGKAKEAEKKVEDLEFDRDQVAQWCGKRKNKLNPAFKELEDKECFLIHIEEPFTHKRIYKLNMELAYGGSIFTGLTTPEELKEKWEGLSEEPVKPDNGNGKADEVGPIPVIPLSHPLEEEK